MPNNNALPIKRQKELIAINRILALLVVFFTFYSGYLLAAQEEWFIKTPEPQALPTPQAQLPSLGLPIGNGMNTPFFKIVKDARYSRVFDDGEIDRETLFGLLFAAQGKITSWGERTVPSYKSQFPISLSVLVRKVAGITPGLYWFNPSTQTLEPSQPAPTDVYQDIHPGLNEAPIILIAGTSKEREGDTNAWFEAGGIAQNVLLAASESKLSSYFIPAANLTQVEIAGLTLPGSQSLWLMPISNTKEASK